MCSGARRQLRRSAVDRRSSRCPPSCRKLWAWRPEACAAPGFCEGGVPVLAVGDDVEEAAGVFHVVGVVGGDGFPGVLAGVGGGLAEGFEEPLTAVGAVVGEGFAGPFAGDQDTASGVAEV